MKTISKTNAENAWINASISWWCTYCIDILGLVSEVRKNIPLHHADTLVWNRLSSKLSKITRSEALTMDPGGEINKSERTLQIKHLKTSTTLAQTQNQKLNTRKHNAEMMSKKNAENTWINACISSRSTLCHDILGQSIRGAHNNVPSIMLTLDLEPISHPDFQRFKTYVHLTSSLTLAKTQNLT